jgi:GGDEF domain-containing protein
MIPARRIVERTRQSKNIYEGREIPLTCSVGTTGLRSEDDLASSFQRTDQALYQAK